MEELITTVILLSANFVLDIRDTVTHQSKAAAYYEVENSENLSEVRRLPHRHAPNIGKVHLAEKKVSHRLSVANSRRRSRGVARPEMSG
jgi:hypothetical protein